MLFRSVCTADVALNRYYCVDVFSIGGQDIFNVELRVFNLETYAMLDRVYFGWLSGSSGASQPNASITGYPMRLLRWGNAGLALITGSDAEIGLPVSQSSQGAGGVFLIDGAAVNPNAAPDVASGTAPVAIASLSSISPQQAPAGSGDVTITIQGTNFTQDSTACWNPNSRQYLPTQYVSPTKLTATLPAELLAASGPLDISVYDPGAGLYSTNALDFTVTPAPGNTQMNALNVAGLAMAWDANSQLLYIGTADYDADRPNSILALNPQTGAVVQAQPVSPNPDNLSDSAGGQFLYATFADTNTMMQFSLPGLSPRTTWTLQDTRGFLWQAGDMKAAPVDPHTTAVTLFNYASKPMATGGVVIYDDGVIRPGEAPGWLGGQPAPAIFDVLAWGSTDSILASAENDNFGLLPFYTLNVTPSGVSYSSQTASFNELGNDLHSDFATGLVYSDDGKVADAATGKIEGDYNASGLVAPDSSLNRVFILGQTAAQANTSSYTVQSFDQKAFSLVSSITLKLDGVPVQMVRWGNSGLAILTSGGVANLAVPSFGTLYLVQDAGFVSNAQSTPANQAIKPEFVKRRWKSMSKREILLQAHQAQANAACCRLAHGN